MMEDGKRQETSYEQKTKDQAIGCLFFIVAVIALAIWISTF